MRTAMLDREMAAKKRTAPKTEQAKDETAEMISVKLPSDVVLIARRLSGHMNKSIADLIADAGRATLKQWERETANKWQSEVEGK